MWFYSFTGKQDGKHEKERNTSPKQSVCSQKKKEGHHVSLLEQHEITEHSR